MTPAQLATLVLLLPLVSAAVIALFLRRQGALASYISVAAAGGIVVVSSLLIFGGHRDFPASMEWLRLGNFAISLGFKFDDLAALMLFVVSFVGFFIHVFSLGYMRDDPAKARYFAGLSIFMFSMLGIVLADNLFMVFVFWELVGFSSYLLIGHWYEKQSASDAAKKAFIVNRVGDFGFLLGIVACYWMNGTVNLTELAAKSAHHSLVFSTAIPLLLFCGAVGKSAQIPLHVWLPDAMEGPTPVSALIHAATMVAAGIYMLCRIEVLMVPQALTVISWIGALTAIYAAFCAVAQRDIKKVLAYSTLSQLGYMIMAIGLAFRDAAMFHLITHAFFKALLFLGAGSVIHALHHEQDIWKMGGLRKKMPVTFWTFIIGTLALCGVPPFSGFYSKDSILAQALEQKNYPLFVLGVLVAGLTTFYMFRLFYVAFLGERRTGVAPVSHSKEAAQAGDESLRQAGSLSYEPHESPPVMAWPLRVLAVFAFIGGVIGINGIFDSQFFTYRHAERTSTFLQKLFEPFVHTPIVAIIGLLAVAAGFIAARMLYRNAENDPLPAKLGALAEAMKNRFYFDEIYEATFIRAHDFIAVVMDWIDRWLVDWAGIGLVRGGTDITGRALRLMQTGNLQTYAFLFALGVAVVLWFVLGK
jgi:NADH-quinone oxidoreductase subunit L